MEGGVILDGGDLQKGPQPREEEGCVIELGAMSQHLKEGDLLILAKEREGLRPVFQFLHQLAEGIQCGCFFEAYRREEGGQAIKIFVR